MKNRVSAGLCLAVFVCLLASIAGAQQNAVVTAQTPSNPVPGLITYSGILQDAGGQNRSSVTGVTFLLYRDQQGGAPLWMETQNVVPDKIGHYTVQLGATTPNGIPANVFQTGEARWLALQIAGEAEQTRVMLVAVPYAMKAADADTVGGLPASAFVLAAPAVAAGNAPSGTAANLSAAPQPAPPAAAVTGSGTANFVPLWTGTTTVGNSVLFQTGSGSTAKIGVNTITPAVTLDVKGSATIRGTLALPAPAAATASAGKNSEPLNLTASAFNSSAKAAVGQTFRWQAEPASNDTASPTGTLNLLFASGAAAPAETGLMIGHNGQITFASGQKFPGTGPGTITGVIAGTDLTGGGASGTVTLNLDTTKVPQLAAANTFTGNQTVNGNLSATGMVTGGGYQIGSNLFAFGSYTNGDVFLGFAGNTVTTSQDNTGVGSAALLANQGGDENTAVGNAALFGNSSGSNNTAVGVAALDNNSSGDSNSAEGYFALGLNTTGNYNTGVGEQAGLTNDDTYITGNSNTFLGANSFAGTGTLANATAVGANSEVTASNSMVLGSVSGVNGAGSNVNVGIGITAPQFALDIHGGMLHVAGSVQQDPTAQGAYLQWNTLTGSTGETDFLNNQGKGSGGFVFMNAASNGGGLTPLMFITGSGKVGIGTTAPDSLLSVNGSADKSGGGSWGTFSDGRLKTLHGSFTAGLSQIMKLHPVRYRYKEQNAMNIRDRDEHVGFVAQEVQRVIPEAVTTNSRGYLMVNNDPILWTMLNAIQQQQAEIRSLRAQLHQPGALSNRLPRPVTSTGVDGSGTITGADQELRRVRAELQRVRKKDAGLESRLARLEQALARLQNPTESLASAKVGATPAEK